MLMQYRNDTIIKQTHEERHRNKGRRKISLQIYFTSHFIARVRKGFSRVACERELETEHKLQYFDPTVMTVTLCLSRSLVLLNWRPRAHSSGPKGHFGQMWLSLPHFVYNSVRSSTQLPLPLPLPTAPAPANCHWDSNSTALYNNSTPTRSPTGSLKSNV